MGTRVRVEEVGGRTVVLKRADTVAGIETLQIEAGWLQRVAHPGVVELLDFNVAGDDESPAATLTTAYAGSVTLANHSPTTVGAGAAVVASLAASVADLHAAGVVHGRLTSDHVIISTTGHPVLCSLGGAVDATPEAIGGDLQALGCLLEDVLDRCESGAGRLPRRQDRALRAAIDSCALPGASAAAFAASIVAVQGVLITPEGDGPLVVEVAEAAPPPTGLPVRPAGDDLETRTWRDRVLPERSAAKSTNTRLYWPGAAVLMALAGLFGYDRSQATPDLSVAPTAEWPVASQEIVPPEDQVDLPGLPTPVSLCVGAAQDQPGCGEALIIGNLIQVGDTWFEAGHPGDHVIVGDWNCDGRSTPAVLRPETGEVFVFPEWRGPGGEVEVPLTAQVSNTVELVAKRSAGCDVLHVVGPDASDKPTPLEGQ